MNLFTKEKPLTPSWQLVNPSVELVKKYYWQIMFLSFLPTLLLTVGLVMIGEGKNIATGGRLAGGIVVMVFSLLWVLLATPGFIHLQLYALKNKDIASGVAFKKGLGRVPDYILMSIIEAIVVALGLLLFIIPGLILIRSFLLAPYYLIDQNKRPVEALKASYNESKPVTGWLWGVIGVTAVFGILGSVLANLPLIGYFLSVGISYIYIFAPALRYGEIAKSIPVVQPSKD